MKLEEKKNINGITLIVEAQEKRAALAIGRFGQNQNMIGIWKVAQSGKIGARIYRYNIDTMGCIGPLTPVLYAGVDFKQHINDYIGEK